MNKLAPRYKVVQCFLSFLYPWSGRPNLAVNVSLFYLFDFFYPFSLSSTIRLVNEIINKCGSEGEESACSAGDLALIPGSARSPGEGHGNPLQCSCLENPRTEEPGRLQSIGSQRVRHDCSDFTHTQTSTQLFGHQIISPLNFLYSFSKNHLIVFACICFWCVYSVSLIYRSNFWQHYAALVTVALY